MARGKLKLPSELAIGLGDPGMTPLLKAGLGGMAASLWAMLRRENPSAPWPSPVSIHGGKALVEPRRVVLKLEDGNWDGFLRTLFESVFRISEPWGIIQLVGGADPGTPPPQEVMAALQTGLERTFLQLGKTRKKSGRPKELTFRIDDAPITFMVQGYRSYSHQTGHINVLKALKNGTTRLASWVQPGAVQRHIAFSETKYEYSAGQALCALFAIVGCFSFPVTRRNAGALVIPEPSDLVLFARMRPRLTPQRVQDVHVTGTADAILAVHLALRMAGISRSESGIASTLGITLRATPWAQKQKSRVSVLLPQSISEKDLDVYDAVSRKLPTRIRASSPGGCQVKDDVRSDDDEPVEGGYSVLTSSLRAFVTENVALGRKWHTDFATATDGARRPRFIHYYRDREGKGLGALYSDEMEGLIAMLDYLEDAEKAIVESVHVALRQRFGRIAEENKDDPVAMKNRFDSERERWRLRFVGAKTHDQIRTALADLWSLAGPNRELQERWPLILPLLRAENWKVARDLALVALASYRGQESEDDGESREPVPNKNET